MTVAAARLKLEKSRKGTLPPRITGGLMLNLHLNYGELLDSKLNGIAEATPKYPSLVWNNTFALVRVSSTSLSAVVARPGPVSLGWGVAATPGLVLMNFDGIQVMQTSGPPFGWFFKEAKAGRPCWHSCLLPFWLFGPAGSFWAMQNGGGTQGFGQPSSVCGMQPK